MYQFDLVVKHVLVPLLQFLVLRVLGLVVAAVVISIAV
jgi:hypothetical protein